MGTQDEASFGLIPNTTRGWAKKGSKPITNTNYEHKYTNVFGARTKKTFVFSFSKRKRQKDFIRFLERLLKKWGKVFLFVDNVGAHKGKAIDEFLAKRKRTLKLEYFPPYTPELNPVEPCWKPAREKLANRLTKTMPTAKYHLRKTFNNQKNLPRMFEYLRD